MDIETTLYAKTRNEIGKGPCRRLRRQGLLPAVFYGQGREARPLTVDYREYKKALTSDSGSLAMFKLVIDDDQAREEKTVTLKEQQMDSIIKTVLHADFQEIDLTRPLEIDVPLILTGKPEGVERGGILQQIRRVLTLSALPKDIPDQIEVDVSHLNTGDSLHVEDVTPPEGVSLVYDVNFTLAIVSALRAAKAAEGAEAELEEVPVEGAEAAETKTGA